jgi:hypothetical protein
MQDVIPQDHVTDAANRLGCKFIESLFYRAALEQGFGHNSEARARELMQVYARQGIEKLPSWTRTFILEVCAGQHTKHAERQVI